MPFSLVANEGIAVRLVARRNKVHPDCPSAVRTPRRNPRMKTGTTTTPLLSLAGFLALLLLVLALASPIAALAQDSADAEKATESETETAVEQAPVMVDELPIFEVPGTKSLPAEERASIISERIEAAAALDVSNPPNVEVAPHELGLAVNANGLLINVLTELDAKTEGAEVEVVGEIRRKRIKEAIVAFREARTSAAYRRGGLYVLLWTAIYIGFIILLWWVRRKWLQRTERRIEAWARRLESQSGRIVDSRSITAVQRLVVRGIQFIIIAIATIYYAGRVLGEFPLTKPIATIVLDVVARPVIAFLQTGADQLPNILTLIFILIVTRFLLKLSYLTFRNIEVGFIRIKNFERRWVWPTHRIVRLALIIAAIVVAFPYVPGSQTAAFQGMSVLLGIMLTLGANSIASNFISGLVVVYKRSVNLGDLIQVGEFTGVVEKMSILDSHLRTYKNELVSIPNSKIISSEVTNLTQMDGTGGLMVTVRAGIGYDEAPGTVENLLLSSADAVEDIKKTPKPFVLTPHLNSHDVTYELHATVKAGTIPALVRSRLNKKVLEAFNDAGVQIMTPFYTGDPDKPKIPGD